MDVTAIFAAQRALVQERRVRFGLAQRRAALRALQSAILAQRSQICAALAQDLGRDPVETELVDILPTLAEISHAKRHLRRWMRAGRVWPTLLTLGTRTRIVAQAKGVVLVVAPWNYPLMLALAPLAMALAAGNSVILKPSEMTPATSALLARLLGQVFPADLVAVVEGGPEVAEALLRLPFDHIFFTGSPAVGAKVMAAAAEHLVPVTLELGGKSPVIVGPDADMAQALRWIVWGKWLNGGQTCVAPDHVYVPQAALPGFVAALRAELGRAWAPGMTHVVSDRHFARLQAMLADATAQGAEVLALGEDEASSRYLAPRILLRTSSNMLISNEEIFGPLLPVLGYDDPGQVISQINAGPKPLTLYVFARDAALISRIEA